MNRDNSKDHLARKAAVIELFRSFTSSQNLGTEVVEAYAKALDPYSVVAVAQACARFSDPSFKRKDSHWHPSAVEIAEQAALFQPLAANDTPRIAADRVPEGMRLTADGTALIVPIGQPIPEGFKSDGGKVSLEGGTIDLRPFTPEERETIMRLNGRTEAGRAMRSMSVEEIREAINQPALPLDRPMPKAMLRSFR